MSMGRGMRMMLLADRGEQQRREDGGQSGSRTYNLDGTYNVTVGDGGNRSDYGGGIRTGDRHIGDPRSEQGESGSRMGYGDPAQARYRGKDGRYHAGRKPTRMGMEDMRGGDRRMGDDEDEEEESIYKVRISPEDSISPMIWPYAPGMREDGGERYANYGRTDDGRQDRQIGFGASMHMGGERDHQQMSRGRTSMQEHEQLPEIDEETAIMWVDSMEGEDRSKPKGGKWSPEQLEPIAKKFGLVTKGPEWWAFYAVTNAMYADYCEVAKAYNITSPDFYAKLALAFMRDKDALPGKVERYLRYVVGM